MSPRRSTLARKRNREHYQLLRRDMSEACEAAGRAFYWLRRIPRTWLCLTGWHRWSAWRDSSSIFSPPWTRRCRRCGGSEYRGATPEYTIRVETGSVHGA